MCSTDNQVEIEQGHGCHGFHDGHGSGQYAGVVTSAGFEGGVHAVHVYGVLLHEYGCHGLEGYAEVDVLSVADAALNAAGVVGMRFDASVVVIEHVVLFGAFHLQSFEAFAVFKRFCGVDTEHAGGKGGLEFAVNGLSQSDGASFDNAGHHAADGIAFALYLEDKLFHFFGFLRVGATHRVGINQVEVVGGIVFFQFDGAYLRGVCGDADAKLF